MSKKCLAGLASLLALAAFAVAPASAKVPQLEKGGILLHKKVKFKDKSGITLLKTATSLIACHTDSSKGRTEGTTEVRDLTFKLEACDHSEPPGPPCHSPGEPEGTIKTNALKGVFGYLGPLGTPPVGMLFSGQGSPIIAEIECPGFLPILLTGKVIGEWSPYNTETTAFTLEFAEIGPFWPNGTKQFWREFEIIPPEFSLEENGAKAWMVFTDEVTFAEALKFK